MAALGDANTYSLPTPLKGREGCDFSFAGLKTAVRLQIASLSHNAPHLTSPRKREEEIADICAAFQKAACACVVDRTRHAIDLFKATYPDTKHMVLAGGLAANLSIRSSLEELLAEHNMQLIAPPIALCTDNAAMIAWAGLERFALGLVDDLTFEPKARWPLS